MAPKKKPESKNKKAKTTIKKQEIKPIQKATILDTLIKNLEAQTTSIHPDNL